MAKHIPQSSNPNIMKHRHHALWAAAFALLLLGTSCAKQGTLTGGPKDETPPVFLGSLPQNGTTNFDAKEIVLNFDEYVQVKDAENNILVSPPMKHKPEYSPRGRGLAIKLRDTLLPNTTYLFQFKSGIVDFNEGNELESFEYVFSTGSTIDSMTLRGQVLDAFTGKPREETVTVIAYAESQMADSIGDSIVTKVQPIYMTRCDKEGNFALNHIREGRYLVLALEDVNKSLRLDAGEAVAFLDTLPVACHIPPPPDTTHLDTIQSDSTSADSAVVDTAATALQHVPDSVSLTDSLTAILNAHKLAMRMSLFKQETQRVKKSEFLHRGRCTVSTMLPLSSQYTLTRPDSNKANNIYIKLESKRDSLHIWTSDPRCDSLVLILTDTNLRDTLSLRFREKSKTKGPSLPQANIHSLANADHPYFDTLWVTFDNPIPHSANDSLTDTLVSIFNLADSTTSHCALRWCDNIIAPSNDSLRYSERAMLVFKGKPGGKYQFDIAANVISDLYGKPNDSLRFTTQYTNVEQYGNIILNFKCPTDSLADPADSAKAKTHYVIQLTNESNNVILQQSTATDCQITFPHLKSGKYRIQAIVDLNGDGIWTAGDYWQHRQPENVLHFGKELELRENWDMEEKWEL